MVGRGLTQIKREGDAEGEQAKGESRAGHAVKLFRPDRSMPTLHLPFLPHNLYPQLPLHAIVVMGMAECQQAV